MGQGIAFAKLQKNMWVAIWLNYKELFKVFIQNLQKMGQGYGGSGLDGEQFFKVLIKKLQNMG